MVSEAANVNGVYGKICHREPWGMALVAGELTGAGCVDHGGRNCRWSSETRIMYQAPRGLCGRARSIIDDSQWCSLHMRVYRVDELFEKEMCLYCSGLRGAA